MTNISLLTVVGIVIMVMLEILDNSAKIFKLVGLLIQGTEGAQKV